jgi:hypothetical protein
MRQIKLDDTYEYNGSTTRSTFIKVWERIFLNEASKFISATYLQVEDLGREYTDNSGVRWKLLGQMENTRELACEKVETGEVFTQDRWKVSQYLRPEEHLNATKVVEYVHPSKKKERKAAAPRPVAQQLDLFSSLEESERMEIISAVYGTLDKNVDVTSKVKAFYSKGETFKVTNHLGGDPCPGISKRLTITFNSNGETITKDFPEKTTVKV